MGCGGMTGRANLAGWDGRVHKETVFFKCGKTNNRRKEGSVTELSSWGAGRAWKPGPTETRVEIDSDSPRGLLCPNAGVGRYMRLECATEHPGVVDGMNWGTDAKTGRSLYSSTRGIQFQTRVISTLAYANISTLAGKYPGQFHPRVYPFPSNVQPAKLKLISDPPQACFIRSGQNFKHA